MHWHATHCHNTCQMFILLNGGVYCMVLPVWYDKWSYLYIKQDFSNCWKTFCPNYARPYLMKTEDPNVLWEYNRSICMTHQCWHCCRKSGEVVRWQHWNKTNVPGNKEQKTDLLLLFASALIRKATTPDYASNRFHHKKIHLAFENYSKAHTTLWTMEVVTALITCLFVVMLFQNLTLKKQVEKWNC